MKPEDLVSPRTRWKYKKTILLISEGAASYAIIAGLWDGEPVLTSRWTGDPDDPNAYGMPMSTGRAVPFVEHSSMWEHLLNHPSITQEDREWAQDFLGLSLARLRAQMANARPEIEREEKC